MKCGLLAQKGVKSFLFLSLYVLPCFYLLFSVCSLGLVIVVGKYWTPAWGGGCSVGGAAEDCPRVTGGGSQDHLQAEAPWSHHLQIPSSKVKLLRISR